MKFCSGAFQMGPWRKQTRESNTHELSSSAMVMLFSGVSFEESCLAVFTGNCLWFDHWWIEWLGFQYSFVYCRNGRLGNELKLIECLPSVGVTYWVIATSVRIIRTSMNVWMDSYWLRKSFNGADKFKYIPKGNVACSGQSPCNPDHVLAWWSLIIPSAKSPYFNYNLLSLSVCLWPRREIAPNQYNNPLIRMSARITRSPSFHL